jgi:tellurite resistance protein TerC
MNRGEGIENMGLDGVGSPVMWGGFVAFIVVMLVLDLLVFHRKAHEVSLKEALGWSIFWIGLAVAFNVAVYHWYGAQKALEFTTGYLIEKALSVDNIFVFLVVFKFFAVPAAYQHRVLFYGILGALAMRALFILLGAALLAQFHWLIYVFGGILLITGARMLARQDEQIHPERNPICKFVSQWVPMTRTYHGEKFTAVENGYRVATPLFLVLVTIEATDLVFAVDSIPAVFAVTRDPFIVFTSNIFAILGLRALFFLLAGIMGRFHLLKVGLALVLLFVGTKMVIVEWYKIPIATSLAVVGALIGGSVMASILVSPSRATSGFEALLRLLRSMLCGVKILLLLVWVIGGSVLMLCDWDWESAMPVIVSVGICTAMSCAAVVTNLLFPVAVQPDDRLTKSGRSVSVRMSEHPGGSHDGSVCPDDREEARR